MARVPLSDKVYKYSSGIIGSSTIVLIALAVAVLLYAAYPSIIVNGLGFFTKTLWDPNPSGKPITINGFPALSGASYGVIVFVVDTLISSGIAVLIAVPAGLGTAIFLTQVAPRRVASPISLMVEMLAGIPSVVFGFWGWFVLGPYLYNDFEPFLKRNFSFIPFLSGTVDSSGLLASGIILAIMIVPIVASISRDTMSRTPKELKDGARALGLTKWETTRKIIIPFAKTAIVGSIILGLGRALGESIAIAMLSGAGTQQLPANLYSAVSTIAAFMALELKDAPADTSGMNTAALMELGIVLLLISVTVNVVARLFVRQGFASSSENLVRV